MTGENGRAAFRFRPRVLELSADAASEGATLGDALERLAERRLPVLLEGAAGEPRRFSLLAFDPLRPARGVDPRPDPARGIEGVRALLGLLTREDGDPLPPFFAGGFAGALAYDLGVAGERLALPVEPWEQPLVVGGLYVDFLVRDERARRTWLVLGDEPGDGRAPIGERRAHILELLRGPAPAAPALATSGPLQRCTPSAEHRARIERARAAIAAGDVYQANLAHRFTRAVEGDPLALHAALSRANAAPYAGCLAWSADDVGGTRGEELRASALGPRPSAPSVSTAVPSTRIGALFSSSPELLLEVDGRRARTRPIKGTIARGADPASDARARAALLASEKDRAELAMIVDLERNDLGRVARTGSVEVLGFPTLESHARVHHLVADVRAELASGVDALDALAALFPGGSVTGAPKLRSMEWIAELEGEGRGFFCGALGLADLAGRACFNILIRTALWRARPDPRAGPHEATRAGADEATRAGAHAATRAGEVSYRVGGGITWSSDASSEDEETLAKGAALAAALDALPSSHPVHAERAGSAASGPSAEGGAR